MRWFAFLTSVFIFFAYNLSAEEKFYISDLQAQLTELGFKPGKVDGKWGRNTEKALQQFVKDTCYQVNLKNPEHLKLILNDIIPIEKIENYNVIDEDFILNNKVFRKSKKNLDVTNNYLFWGRNTLVDTDFWNRRFTKHIHVSDLQNLLFQAGYGVLNINGDFDQITSKALNKFLDENNFIDRQKLMTLGKLRKLLDILSIKNKTYIPKILIKQDNSTREINTGQIFSDGKLYKNCKDFKKSSENEFLVKLEEQKEVLSKKLELRKTINPFMAWRSFYSHYKYSLIWDRSYNEKAIGLREVYWNYHYSGSHSNNYAGLEKYLTKRNWGHDKEYGKTVATKIIAPQFPNYIADVTTQEVMTNKADGAILDWWHNDHAGGYSGSQVRNARKEIIKNIRKKLGENFIILGNVNWRKETDTINYLSGVFLELYKTPYYQATKRLYNSQELRRIQDVLQYYEKKLQFPKIIALEGWRKTKNLTDEDRNSTENRRMAKLLTAMSVVIPTHGYILYGDNNPDTEIGDHHHLYYDFYDFDIGKPTSEYIKVTSGVGYKEHEQGFIAYNINSNKKKLTRDNGQSFEIAGKSGLFCKDVENDTECLPID